MITTRKIKEIYFQMTYPCFPDKEQGCKVRSGTFKIKFLNKSFFFFFPLYIEFGARNYLKIKILLTTAIYMIRSRWRMLWAKNRLSLKPGLIVKVGQSKEAFAF